MKNVPSPDKFGQLVGTLVTAVNAAANGDRQMIQAGKHIRTEVVGSVAVVATEVLDEGAKT